MTFRNATSGFVAGGTGSITLAKPTGTVAGDGMVAGYTLDSTTGTMTWPAAFIEITGSPLVSIVDSQRMHCATQIAGGSEGANYTLSNSNTSEICAFVASWGGTSATTLLDVTPTAASTGTSGSPASFSATGLTPITDGCTLVHIGGSDLTLAGSETWADPTSPGTFANRVTQRMSGNFSGIFMSDYIQAAKAATGTVTATDTFTGGGQTGRMMFLLALRPATTATGGGGEFKAQGPGNTPMSGGGGERFRPFVQGVPAAAVIPQGWPGIGKDQQIHPGAGPGNRPFPNFVQGIPAAAVIPQGNPGTVQITAMHPGQGPGARQFPDFRQGIAPPVVTTGTVNATPGTWTWAGVDATTSQLIHSDGGASAWTWAGTTATTSQLTNATPGTWNWAGLTAATSQLVNASPGAWTWAGTTASTSQFVSATPAAYTWAGVDAATTQLVNAGAGTWIWAGTTATLGGALDATPGTWTWIGTTAEIPTLIGAGIGIWSWSGTTATIPSGGGGGGKHHRRHQIRVGKQILEGSKEQIEAIARELALRERDSAPEVVEIVVPSKRNKPALTAKTQLAADVRAAYSKAVADEVARQLELDDEEALIALLT